LQTNGLGGDIDAAHPSRQWKGPWRWFSEELLDCCKPLEEIRHSGVSLDEVACLARCAGADVALHRPDADSPGDGVERFRAHVIESATRDDAPVLTGAGSPHTPSAGSLGHLTIGRTSISALPISRADPTRALPAAKLTHEPRNEPRAVPSAVLEYSPRKHWTAT